MALDYSAEFTVALVGPGGSGKTAILHRIEDDSYDESERYRPTIGFDFIT